MKSSSVRGESELCSDCRRARAQHSCACEPGTRLFCTFCLSSHLNSPGNHMLETLLPDSPDSPHSVEPVPTAQERCAVCKSSPALNVCICTAPATRLCSECVSLHMQQDVLGDHSLHSLSVADRLATHDLIESFKARQKRMRTIIAKINAVKADVETAKRKVYMEIDTLKEKLGALAKKAESELESEHQSCNFIQAKASSEVREHIYEDEYRSSDAFIQSIWNAEEATIPLAFSGSSFINSFETELLRIFLGDTGVTGELLPYIDSFGIKLYIVKKGYWLPQVRLSSQIYVDSGSNFIRVDEQSVFTCGGLVKRVRTAYLVNSHDGKVKELPNMHTSRGYAGCWLNSAAMYLFGGLRHSLLKCCEVFDLTTLQWSALPEMAVVRAKFNPCEMDGELYIAGASIPSKLEVFNFSSKSFRQVDIEIPAAPTSLLLPYKSGLLLIQYQKQYYLSLRTITPQLDRRVAISYSVLPPTVVGNSVYLLDSNRKLVKFDLDGEGYDELET